MVYFAKNKTHIGALPTMKCFLTSSCRMSIALLFSFCMSITQTTLALESDRDQPADIQADDTEINFKTGTRTFINNVIAIQGTLRLKADKLIAIYEEGALKQATMWGDLARFRQRPDGKPDDVEGSARKMIVNQQANTITLLGKATLQQGPDTARGETIIYNMATDTLQVKGGSQFGSGGEGGTARPNKKLEDPFKDDVAPPPAPSTDKKASEENTSDNSSNDADDKQAETPWVAPTKKGRSRLILRPRKKPKENEESDDSDKDSDEKHDKESDDENSDKDTTD